jgi:folate-binding protein YgfZ
MSIENALPSYQQLPDTFAMKLDSLSAISLQGEEQSKYLQGQVTCDVDALAEQKLLTGAHCNAKGKVFSAFRLINRADAHWLIQAKSSIEQSLAELKKFGVFAKVEIKEVSDSVFYALAGVDAAATVSQHFGQVPDMLTPVITVNGATLIYLAGKIARYIIIDNIERAETHLAQLDINVYPHAVWQLLEINEGFPTLSTNAIGEYVPQMLNLQAIGGISFTKGCYLGQETVARMQYLGKNKRALFALSGQTEGCNAGDSIEKQLGENWRIAGTALTSYQADNGETYIQAVLANDVSRDTALHIKGQQSGLNLITLPYTINTEAE